MHKVIIAAILVLNIQLLTSCQQKKATAPQTDHKQLQIQQIDTFLTLPWVDDYIQTHKTFSTLSLLPDSLRDTESLVLYLNATGLLALSADSQWQVPPQTQPTTYNTQLIQHLYAFWAALEQPTPSLQDSFYQRTAQVLIYSPPLATQTEVHIDKLYRYLPTLLAADLFWRQQQSLQHFQRDFNQLDSAQRHFLQWRYPEPFVFATQSPKTPPTL